MGSTEGSREGTNVQDVLHEASDSFTDEFFLEALQFPEL